MSKQKLFENVGGNNFRLITENVEESKSKLVREGLRKVFGGGKQQITYQFVQNVGLGYIKDVSEARKCALEEARIVAKEYGYGEDEAKAKFIKEVDFYDDTNSAPPSKKPTSQEEQREVQIGKEILRLCKIIVGYKNHEDHSDENTLTNIERLAQELITMHTGGVAHRTGFHQ